MKILLKQFGVLTALFAAGVCGVMAQGKNPAAAAPDSVVARGKNFEVKRSRLDEAVNSYQANAVSRGREIPPDRLVVIEAQLLDRLIESAILNRGIL